jgi:hypothetical protein
MVSVGKPYMSTSTYVPTYKPHRFYFDLNRLQYDRYLFIRQKLTGDNLYGTLSCDHAIYWTFGERVERSVMSPHEIRFQQVTTVAVVFKFTLVQLHGQVGRLKIERHHLTAGIPEDLRHVIRRVGSGTARIDARHLAFVVIDEFDRLALQIVQTRRFGKARHVVMDVPFYNRHCKKIFQFLLTIYPRRSQNFGI